MAQSVPMQSMVRTRFRLPDVPALEGFRAQQLGLGASSSGIGDSSIEFALVFRECIEGPTDLLVVSHVEDQRTDPIAQTVLKVPRALGRTPGSRTGLGCTTALPRGPTPRAAAGCGVRPRAHLAEVDLDLLPGRRIVESCGGLPHTPSQLALDERP